MCYLQTCFTIDTFEHWNVIMWIKSKNFAWFASWKSNGWSYLYTKNVITCFEWRIVGQFHCEILDIKIFTMFYSHLEQK
jgi:hypothetical protein